MSLLSNIYELSTTLLNGGYVKPNIEISIWLLEKCNNIGARTKLGELYLLKKYNTSFEHIVDILQFNINQRDIYSKYLLANVYLVHDKYEYAYNLLNEMNILNDFHTIENKSKVLNLLFFMGIYILDKKNDIEYGKKYLTLFFNNLNKDFGILKYILCKYCNDCTLDEAYQAGDLYSCYLIGNQTQDVKYYKDFINRYDSCFYMKYLDCNIQTTHIPTKNDLRNIYRQCKSQCKIYNSVINIITNKELKSSKKILQKYISNKNISSTYLKYNISIAGFKIKLSPSHLFFERMLECVCLDYLDSKYYLGIMYFKQYGTSKNNKLSLELLESYQKKPNLLFIDVYYYLIKIYYEEKQYNKILQLYTQNNTIIDKLEKLQLGDCYYILSLIYLDQDTLNLKLGIKYLEDSILCNNLDAYFKMGVLLTDGKIIKQDNVKAKEYFTYASNNGHQDALCNLAYFYYNEINTNNDIATNENKDTAITLWKKLAELNNSNALYYLGIYYKMIGDKTYITYLKRSAKLNNKNALYSLAQFYNEIGEKDNYLKYLDDSAKYGNKDAVNEIYQIALEYKENENINMYIKLLNSSADYGNLTAKHDLLDYNKLQDLRNI